MLNILSDTIGKYVEGISKENLHMGVGSGELEFSNLSLRPDGLEELELPISVVHGKIRTVRLIVPWRHLGSEPVIVHVDGVLAQIIPHEEGPKSPDIAKHITDKLKEKILKQAENLAFVNACNSVDISGIDLQHKSSTLSTFMKNYAQRLISKILRSIEIRIANVHIRYEDDLAIPERVVAGGVSFTELVFTATDGNWNELKHVEKDSREPMFKLLSLKNFTLYWDTHTIKSGARNRDAKWEGAMDALIYNAERHSFVSSAQTAYEMRSAGDVVRPANFIFAAPNELSIKMIQQPEENRTALVPKLEVATCVN